MTRFVPRGALAALALVLLPAAATVAAAQEAASGLQGDLARDIAGLEEKYVALAAALPAEAMAWRPMEGVRSGADVLCHVAGANYRIPGFFGVEQPAGAEGLEAVCTTEDLEALKAALPGVLGESFAFARQAVTSVADSRLAAPTRLFGQDTTVRAAMLLYVTHMHEHLGQLVAYARSNGVVPPWSAGG
jgi:uncharacterized damage-inducible protein DinB